MSKEIKQNLFRFVTLRNPQLIDEKKEHPGFVYHPELEVAANQQKSEFLKAIQGIDEADRKATLKKTSTSFPAIKTRVKAKGIKAPLYKFSSWLMRHKNSLSYAEIAENAIGVQALTLDEEVQVWDNLVYQTINKASVYVREAMIQLLVANQFFKAFDAFSQGLTEDITFTDDQAQDFVRRANASVVISKELLTAIEKPVISKNRITIAQKKAALNTLEVRAAKETIKELEALKSELKKAEITFNKETQIAFDDAMTAHEASIEAAYAAATPVMVTVTDKDGNTFQKETFPNVELPEFNFEKKVPIKESYLENKIPQTCLDVIKNKDLELYETFPKTYKQITRLIEEEKKTILSKSPKKAKRVRIGGSTIRVKDTSILLPYCFSASMFTKVGGQHSLSMVLGTGYPNAQATNVNLVLIDTDSNITYDNPVQQMPSEITGELFFEMFLGLIQLPSTYRLSGTISLDNGVDLVFNDILNEDRVDFGACCDVVNDSEEPPITSEKEAPVYGVTNLGIADFRRVEQEVCCYVPGEVSHIENIMAREYKERSTRSLLSSETTTERTDSTERENLTDTTTAERNEMQSEVASVLNEDESKAYGANSSVSGNFPGGSFGAGAYFDASSASSSSNSNSQAQTYAQEVTERAMERIVQKVETKRTSRILKEFEENNKHGFDNTEGDQHVTGVYRWVDKIYKNKLINYGKRLMYEFAIPEPARFLREALWKQKDAVDSLESGVILPDAPIHPHAYSSTNIETPIGSAEGITEDNYQELAAQYNAEVNPTIENELIISKAFKLDFTANSGAEEGSSLNEVIEIPEGYVTESFKTAGVMYHEGSTNSARMRISVGNIALNEQVTTKLFSTGSSFGLDNISDELAVSVSSYDTLSASFNVTVECVRKQLSFEAWQNETYKAIMDAYNERLLEYNDAIKAEELILDPEAEKLSFNPLFNRSLEKRELKRIAVELLTEQKDGVTTSKDNYTSTAFNSKVDTDAAFQTHASTVKFFEQAFDWEIMAYTFYPYMYAHPSQWVDLFQEQDAADPLFQAFLQSGMARTVVPVREGFEDAVNWYMETGEIWNGQGLVVDTDDDLYVSVAEELQTVEGDVEGTWETRLPTNLTMLQAGAIGLDVEGLPCNPDCGGTDNPIGPSEALLAGQSGAVTKYGVGSAIVGQTAVK